MRPLQARTQLYAERGGWASSSRFNLIRVYIWHGLGHCPRFSCHLSSNS